MKKIIFIVDCTLKQCHSVRDILYSLLTHEGIRHYENVIVNAYRTSRNHYNIESFEGYKTYSVPEITFKSISGSKSNCFVKIYRFLQLLIRNGIKKIPRIRHIYSHWDEIQYFKRIFKTERPDMIVYFLISPIKDFSKLCNKMSIPYISLLYDTYIERPGINSKELTIEEKEIKNSVGYFVPDFFAKAYFDYYNYKNIFSYHLPLLIPKDQVINAYKKATLKYDFAYYGQIQSFRNGSRMKEIFKALGYSLNIFSIESGKNDDVFLYHPAVSDAELFETVASSKFLVAFDNGEPYSHYLPSKAYLYVSFTKPIIVLGNNKSSAMINFFKNYPFYFYYNIEEGSLDDLKEFISKTENKGFDEKTYSLYTDYLPQNALKDVANLINKTINKE